jgi:hypothetical protein
MIYFTDTTLFWHCVVCFFGKKLIAKMIVNGNNWDFYSNTVTGYTCTWLIISSSLFYVNIYYRWFVFSRMDFLEQSHIKAEAWDQKSISNKTYQR